MLLVQHYGPKGRQRQKQAERVPTTRHGSRRFANSRNVFSRRAADWYP